MLAGAGLQASAALLLQAIQRRLEEIEVTFRELEQQGIKLEKLLRDENGKARVDGALGPWMGVCTLLTTALACREPG